MDIKRNFFTGSGVKNWNRLPREMVKSASLGVFKKHLDVALGDVA